MNIKFESTMHKQRFTLGIICGLLPICCVLFGLFGKDVNQPGWWYSISATYYATSSPWMIGSLCLSSFFFFTYKGYDLGDKWFTTLSSIMSICIVIFPCYNAVLSKVGIFQLPVNVSSIFHNISAGTLFVSFGLMIMFRFTKGARKGRNILYRICASIIFLSAIGVAIGGKICLPGYSTIIFETTLLEAFAVAWIVKSDVKVTFNDSRKDRSE